MLEYPRAVLLPGTVPTRRKPKGSTRRGSIHTTETKTTNGFYDIKRTKDYYTFQYLPLGWGGNGRFLQVLDPEQISHALRHRTKPTYPVNDPETNGEGIVNPSLVLVGYAKDAHLLTDEDCANLADFLVWAEKALGIKPSIRSPLGGSECYGYNSPCRVSWADWKKVTGWLGHQQIPGQTHWDPGKLPTARIHAAVEAIKNPSVPVPPDPDPDPEPDPEPEPPVPDPQPEEDIVEELTRGLEPGDINALVDAGIVLPQEQWVKDYWIGLLANPKATDWRRFWANLFVRTALK